MPTRFYFGTQSNPVRFSFMHIWEPSKLKSEKDESKARYSVRIMLPKDNPVCKDMAKAIDTEKEFGKTEVWKGKIPGGLKKAYRDGDDEDVFPDRPEYRGHWIIEARAVNKPGIVKVSAQGTTPIMDRDDIGGGDYGIVDGAFNAYAFDDGVSNGINVYLNNICVTKRGERFGGREDAETAFKDFVKPEGYNPLDDESELDAPPKSKAKRNLLD